MKAALHEQPAHGPPMLGQGHPTHECPLFGQPTNRQPVYGQPPLGQGHPTHSRPIFGQAHDQPMLSQAMHCPPVHSQSMHCPPVHDQPIHGPQVHDRPMHGQAVHIQPNNYLSMHRQPVHGQLVNGQPVHGQPMHCHPKPQCDQPMHGRTARGPRSHDSSQAQNQELEIMTGNKENINGLLCTMCNQHFRSRMHLSYHMVKEHDANMWQ